MHCIVTSSVAILALLIPFSNALAINNLYPHGPLVDDALGKEADVSSAEIQLTVPVHYYQNTFNSIYVNDNGLVSFITEIPSFFNTKLPLQYPIIAIMYSNVDTRASGTIYYRETKKDELLERATSDVVRHFSDGHQFRAQSLFIATWVDVGRFDKLTDLKNTVQLVIASNASQSYAFILYPENGIQWIQGQGSIDSTQDAITQVGFMSSDGRYYIVPGSGTEQVKNLPRMSNINRQGLFAFHIGDTGNGNIKLPDRNYEEGLELKDVETCANTQFPCVPSANCIEFPTGMCCQCKPGFYGNGRSCVSNNEHLRVNGKIHGIINDIELNEQNYIHSYVEVQYGRVYSSVNDVNPNLGYDMQTTLVGLSHIVGWLFAVPVDNAPNGYTITGGVFNRTLEIKFPQTGHQATIREQYNGLDVFNVLNVKTEVRGTFPTIPSDTSVVMEDYQLEFTRVSQGTLKSHMVHSFNFGENTLDMPIIISQTITFDECLHRPQELDRQTTRLTVTRNHIEYDQTRMSVRYAFYESTISYISGANPCHNVNCGPYSTCIVEGSSYRCTCNEGFEMVNNALAESSRPVCTDIDECRARSSLCHPYAECINLPGSYQCRCIEGFVGDGRRCDSMENECNNIQCNENAECIQTKTLGPRCICKNGFYGNGLDCKQIVPDSEDCRSLNLCDLNADCKLNRLIGRHICVCKAGFRGDGIVCTEESESCEKLFNCGANAECITDQSNNGNYYCSCNQGYVGDGFTCIAEINSDDCSILNNCHRHASCAFNSDFAAYQCRCNFGFTGDGYRCFNATYINTCNGLEGCSPNADCVFDMSTHQNVCRCRPGFVGNGLVCNVNNECDPNASNCHPNAACRLNDFTMKYECQCNPGYYGNGIQCAMDEEADCRMANNCDRNATCVIEPNTLRYFCRCNTGFVGDGKSCKRHLSCQQMNNCDVKAECLFDNALQNYRCVCSPGFEGDGYNCRPLRSCREDRSVCDKNADCLFHEQRRDYSCHCQFGFLGDGYQCSPVPVHEGDYLLFAHGTSVLRMPLDGQPSNQHLPNHLGYPLFSKSEQTIVALEVDCLEGYLYWSDVAKGHIYKATNNGSSAELLLDGVTSAPEGLALDWVSRNLYWTDSFKKTIEVANLDGSLHKVIFNTDLINPRGIAVHPGNAKLYWSDWNRESPKIEYSNLDGTQRSVLVSTDLKLPNNLVIDYDHNDLCWADAGMHRIECLHLYSKSRRVIFAQASYPFDLAIAQRNIYWTDWETKTVQQIDRNGGVTKGMDIPPGGHGRLYGLVTVPRHCPRISNACSVKNGGCKHFCFPNDKGRACVCPDNAYDEDDICNDV